MVYALSQPRRSIAHVTDHTTSSSIRIGVRLVPVMPMASNQMAARDGLGPDGFDVQSEPLQQPADEGTAIHLLADARVNLRQSALAHCRIPVTGDCLRQAFGPVEGG
jgi:hypothetical protein